MEPIVAVVGMGANVGDRLAALRSAIAALDALAGVTVLDTSAVYETEALVRPGDDSQPDHLNAAVALVTTLGPHALLRALHAIERAAGRDPSAQRWAPRPLDLDLLLYGAARIDAPGLTVPHPALATRRFVLVPLADVAPEAVVSGLDMTVADLLAACDDPLAVRGTALRLVC